MRDLFSVGDEVVAPYFGRRTIERVVQRERRNWNHAEYYFVRLATAGISHLFGPHELEHFHRWYRTQEWHNK